MKTRSGTQYTYPPRRQMGIPDGVLKGRISRNWPVRRPFVNTRSKGMKNRLNECYKIALLQALFHVPQMYQYLGNAHKECELLVRQCVTCAIQSLWQVYWNDKRWPDDQKRLRRAEERLTAALKASVPKTITYGDDGGLEGLIIADEQAESNDFLCYLLKQLQLKHDCRKIRFDQMFRPGAQAQWTCEHCGEDHVEQLPNDFLGGAPGNDFGIELWINRPERGLTLKQYLRHRLVNNRDNNLQCHSAACAGRYGSRNARIFFTSAPEVLTIKLQRGVPGEDEQTGEYKTRLLRDRVVFEEQLDLSRYMVDRQEVDYELMGVVAHNLMDLNGGHYISVVRAQPDNGFCTLDDVRAVKKRESFNFMQAPRSNESKFYPTVLVYSRMPQET